MRRRLSTMTLEKQHLACLASPRRVDVVSAMRFRPPVSVSDLSKILDLSSETLHYHVKALKAAGLVQEVGNRRAGKRFESLFDLVATNYSMHLDSPDSEYRSLARHAVKRILRLAEVEHLAASERADKSPELWRLALVERFNMRLAPDMMEEVKAKFEELVAWARSLDDPAGIRFAGIVAITPVKSP